MTTFLSVAGVRVRVRIVGEGEPLLMLMGLGGNLEMWEPLARRLPDRQLIMFDFPGTGGSGTNWLPPTFAANALFTRRLLRRMGYDRVDVLGYSWGGLLAQHLALQHRSSVRRLVLAATSVCLGGVPASPAILGRMLTPARYYSREHFRQVAPKIYGGRLRHDHQFVDEEASRRIGHPPGLHGYAAQMLATLAYSTMPALPYLNTPTLIVGGDDDPLVPVANQRILAKLIRGSQLHVVPGGGHLFLLDSPESVAPVITRFLSADPVS